MILQKKESLQQKNSVLGRNTNRRSGQIEWVTGMFFVLFLSILLLALLQIKAYCAASLYIEDALAASNLASAIVDIREYGSTHNLLISDVQKAYEKYCMALQGNLQLDGQWYGTNKALVSGKVTIEKYIIYNVRNNEVMVHELGQNGMFSVRQETIGSCIAPNGVLVVSTGIYSEISFPVEGIWGVQAMAHKGKLVDIVAETN